MATTAASQILGCITGTSCKGLENRAVFWLSLLIYICVASACSSFFLFTYRFGVLFFSFFVSYNLLFFNKKTNVWQVTICTLHSLFYFRVTSNFIPPCSLFLYFRVTSNSILPGSRQLRARNFFFLVTADDIFIIGAINKVIKPILKYVR